MNMTLISFGNDLHNENIIYFQLWNVGWILIENIDTDRHCIRTDGGNWIHQVPSKPNPG